MKTKQTKQPKQKELCRFVVSGVQYSDYQKCKSLKVGTPVTFTWERQNKFDSNAIRIDCGGVKIGYVPKGEHQDTLHVYREQRIKITGVVTAYNKNNPTWQMITIGCSAKTLLPEDTEPTF